MAAVLQADLDRLGVLHDVEVGDDEPARRVDDHARPGRHRRLQRGIGNSEILTEEGVAKQRVLGQRRRLKDGDVDHRPRGLADERREVRRISGELGQRGGRTRIARAADRNHPGDDSAEQGGDQQEEKDGEERQALSTRTWIGHDPESEKAASVFRPARRLRPCRRASAPSPAPAPPHRRRASGRDSARRREPRAASARAPRRRRAPRSS